MGNFVTNPESLSSASNDRRADSADIVVNSSNYLTGFEKLLELVGIFSEDKPSSTLLQQCVLIEDGGFPELSGLLHQYRVTRRVHTLYWFFSFPY